MVVTDVTAIKHMWNKSTCSAKAEPCVHMPSALAI